MENNFTNPDALRNYYKYRTRTLNKQGNPNLKSSHPTTPKPTRQTPSQVNVIHAWLTPTIRPVPTVPLLQAIGIPLPLDINNALVNLNNTDLIKGAPSVFIESNDLSLTPKISDRLRGVLTHLLTICAQRSDLTSNDFIIQVNTDDYNTGHSVSRERYATHWDFFEDVFEMHQKGEPVPEFKRFFAYSGEQFTPTEYLNFTLDDLGNRGLHPNHFITLPQFKAALNNISEKEFKSCPHRFQCLSNHMLHRAPRRDQGQLFIGFISTTEKTYYTSRTAPLPTELSPCSS